ncbi:uncharacterized protein LOC135080135 isoform X2 [Ostrinia nubilalis]|uniref:uncharacterized protein LOC135080135 isoform X1 n=1 Tax=Ostrinia nubilalis TaxID=29057 RepID=UPI0030824E38
MRMKAHPLGCVDPKANREIYRQISELCGQTVMDIVAQIKADPFGCVAGIYNIKTHLHQMQAVPGAELLWSSNTQEPRPLSPPEYHAKYEAEASEAASCSKIFTPLASLPNKSQFKPRQPTPPNDVQPPEHKIPHVPAVQMPQNNSMTKPTQKPDHMRTVKRQPVQSPRFSMRPLSSNFTLKNPVYKVYDNGDCGLDPRLPSIDEHSNTDLNDKKIVRKGTRTACVRKVNLEEERPRLNSCPTRNGEAKRTEFYRRGGDGLPSWRASGMQALNAPPARILLQSNATTIKRASLGPGPQNIGRHLFALRCGHAPSNIVSPHSSSNSHCKSERAMPVGWYSTRNTANKDAPHLQRLRRTTPLK